MQNVFKAAKLWYQIPFEVRHAESNTLDQDQSLQKMVYDKGLYTWRAFLYMLCIKFCVCLCWGFTAQSTQWGHVERGQFT